MDIKLKIELEKPKSGGVYRLDFDNGMFYIGSSVKLIDRARNWKSFLKSKAMLRDMKRMRQRIENCKTATFSVIGYRKKGLREFEYKCIKSNENDKLMLNIFSFEKKPIIEYDMEGNEIKKWGSAYEAAKVKGVKQAHIRSVLTGGLNHHKGCVYRYQNKEHFFYKRRYKPVEKKIKVLRFTLEGEPAGEFFTTIAAAKATGVDSKGVYSVLVGKCKTSGGYTFKYA
jgi:hypothetical protein